MYIHTDARMRALQARFLEISGMVDENMEPVLRFAPNHRAEIYKAILKTLVIGDAPLVDTGAELALEKYPGGIAQVYPMLHLPNDTNERGGWHRDDKIDTRRVFWIPLTLYKYPGLSVMPWTSGLLSLPAAFAGSRGMNLDPIAKKLNVVDSTYYSWSPRMVHRGNLNTSNELSAALVIFVDQNSTAKQKALPTLTRELVRERVNAIVSAMDFTNEGQISRIDHSKLETLEETFRSSFYAFFALRTKLDLTQWQPAGA